MVEELSARVPQPEDVRHALADPRLPRLAGREAGRPTSRACCRTRRRSAASALGDAGADPAPQALAAILAKRGWWREAALRKTAEPVLVRLCARYLLVEANGGKRARDPVAHFHLSNGARVERINMLGDTSEKGAKESATLMVNYLYDPARIEDWHEDYAGEGKRNASTTVRRLARGWS